MAASSRTTRSTCVAGVGGFLHQGGAAGPSCTRGEAIVKFQGHFKDQGLFNDIGEIVGKDILCHCRPEEECHGDYLLAMAHHGVRQEGLSMAGFVDDGLPVRINSPKPPEVPVLSREISAGWRGGGPPRMARHIGGDKPFNDGGGLCSPGRWPPERRRLPSCFGGVKAAMQEQFGKAVLKASGGKDDSLSFMLKMAAGRFKACPFGEETLEDTRVLIRDAVGMSVEDDAMAAGQVFHLPPMAKLLRIYGDPDWEFAGSLGDGMALRVDEQIPRTSAVFEEKGKWKLPDDVADMCDNYRSVDPHIDKVKAVFQEEAALGWMEENPEDVAKEKIGKRLAIAALGGRSLFISLCPSCIGGRFFPQQR
jgi:hypothetical protein